MSLSAAHASTPCGAPRDHLQRGVHARGPQSLRVRDVLIVEHSTSEVYSHAGGSPERSSRRAATA